MDSPAKTVVLVVEDDLPSRELLGVMLEDAGYAPIHAADAERALSQLQAHPEIDLVLTDLHLSSGMNGYTLIQALRAQGRHLPAILTTGDSTQLDVLPTNTTLLPKPYRYAQLLGTLEQSAMTARPGQ